MDANDYQTQAKRTLGSARPLSDEEAMLVWYSLGLAGEAGEVADHIKKIVFHRHSCDKQAIAKELGDVMWYISALSTRLGIPLSSIMEANLQKLQERYPDGFSELASKLNR